MGLRGSGQHVLRVTTAPRGGCVDSVGARAAGGKHLENELPLGRGLASSLSVARRQRAPPPAVMEVTTSPPSRHLPAQGCNPCLAAGVPHLKPFSHCSAALVEAAVQTPQKLTLPVPPASTPRPLPARVPLPSLSLLPGMSASTLPSSPPWSVYFRKGQPRSKAMRRPPHSATPNASQPQTGSEAPILFHVLFLFVD